MIFLQAADGTAIAYDELSNGMPLILVDGAFCCPSIQKAYVSRGQRILVAGHKRTTSKASTSLSDYQQRKGDV